MFPWRCHVVLTVAYLSRSFRLRWRRWTNGPGLCVFTPTLLRSGQRELGGSERRIVTATRGSTGVSARRRRREACVMVNKKVGVGFGLVYVLVGVVGFFVTGFNGFASMNGPLLLGIFMLNPLHNIVHVLVGAVLVAGGLAAIKVSRRVNTTVGAVYLLVFAMGLALQASTANILALNGADHGLHLISALLLATVGLAADRYSGTDRTSHSEGGSYRTVTTKS